MKNLDNLTNEQCYQKLCSEFLYKNDYNSAIEYKTIYRKKNDTKEATEKNRLLALPTNIENLIQWIQLGLVKEIKKQKYSESDLKYTFDFNNFTPIRWANLVGNREILDYFYSLMLTNFSKGNSKKNSLGGGQLYWALACKIDNDAIVLINQEKDDKQLEASLSNASFFGNVAAVALLIEKLSNHKDFKKIISIALYKAADNGYHEVVEQLIKAGANVNEIIENKFPLWIASQNGHDQVVEKILGAKNVEIEKRDLVEETNKQTKTKDSEQIKKDLEISRNKNYLRDSTVKSTRDIKGKKINSAIVITSQENEKPLSENSTSLHVATNNGHLKVVRSLVNKGAHLESKDSELLTPLLIAVKNDDLEMAELLLKLKANPNALDAKNNKTALFYAVENNNVHMVSLLIKYHANIEYKNITNETVKELAKNQRKQSIFEFLTLYEMKLNLVAEKKNLCEAALTILEASIKLDIEDAKSPKPRSPSLFKKDPFSKLISEIKKAPEKLALEKLLSDNKAHIDEIKYNFITEFIFSESWEEKKPSAETKKQKKGSKIKYIFSKSEPNSNETSKQNNLTT